MESVWIFNGVQSQFPSGVFSTKESAEAWIGRYSLTGTLTRYPVDVGMYDYAVHNGRFKAKKPEHSTAFFIGGFTAGGIDHFHYEDGLKG